MSEQHAGQAQAPVFEEVPHRPARDPSALARLAALYDEAAETTRLANLLGRTPWLAALLAAGALAVFAYLTGFAVYPGPLTWSLLTVTGAVSLLVLYGHAVRAPFDVMPLWAFRAALKPALFCCGCVWGTGMMFVGADGNLLTILIFSAGMAALAEVVLQADSTAHFFAVPAILVAAAALAAGPIGVPMALVVLAAGLLIVVAAAVTARLAASSGAPFVTVS